MFYNLMKRMYYIEKNIYIIETYVQYRHDSMQEIYKYSKVIIIVMRTL